MTPSIVALYVLKFMITFVVGFYPAYEVAEAAKQWITKNIYPSRNRRTIAATLTLSFFVFFVVSLQITYPAANWVYLILTL